MDILERITKWASTAVIAFLVAALLITTKQLSQERVAHQQTIATHAIQLAQAKDEALQASESARKKEQDLQDAIHQAHQARQKLARELSARAAAARTADQRLHDAARSFAAQAGQACPTASPGPIAGSNPDLLADVLGELAARTTALAEQADTQRQDAQYCRAQYDRARKAMRE